MGNTGNKVFLSLVEKYVSTNLPTGFTKPNLPTDPDYIPPVVDLIGCAPETTTTTTLNTCGTIGFNLGAYFEIETEDGGTFFWNLPVNMSLISSIVSWSIRVETSQSCRTSTGFIHSQLDSWDVLVSGSSGSGMSSITGDGYNETGDLFSGGFTFDPIPYLTFTPNPCGSTRKVWQNQTTITLTINYLDLCNNPQTFSSISYIPEYRVTITSGGGGTGGGCLFTDTEILLANNDVKYVQDIVEGDVLRGLKQKKESCHFDTFKDSLFIQVEVEKVDKFIVEKLICINGLKMSVDHKHVVLRKNTLMVIKSEGIVEGDRVYNFEKMLFSEVKDIQVEEGEFEVYNIQIKGDYKYYFANYQLTHNKTMPPSPPMTIV